MRASSEIHNMAVFCDFENIALGAREAKFERFEIKILLEKLLVKGSIVVKKAYCDWERYKEFKKVMHEAAFELIEIPHVRQSGKNSADIRLVVDALDLCYTKAHVDAFVIVSGDSDFSPLVSKLRENNKRVIGIGVRASTSDLLIRNCDEFLFYDDLARADESRRSKSARKPEPRAAPKPKSHTKQAAAADGTPAVAAEPAIDARKLIAIELVAETFQELVAERGSDERILPSQLKQALTRRHPEFSEAAYGYKLFGRLLDDAAARALLRLVKDEKSGQTHVRLPAHER
jgi:uncharacterized protein (TIGR00288 family)